VGGKLFRFSALVAIGGPITYAYVWAVNEASKSTPPEVALVLGGVYVGLAGYVFQDLLDRWVST